MTDQASTNRTPARRRRPQLYRTLLGMAVAALLAAWMPFSILYINALTKHAVAVATAGSGARVVNVTSRHATHAAAPITTRTSGGVTLP
jgi:hypothetical protein